jgi:hypothetical protein
VIRALRRAAATVLCLTAVACLPFHNQPVADEWPGVLAGAQSRAVSGEFAAADNALVAYALAHPDTREAVETLYWRALFKLDPANADGSVTAAVASLDAYLASLRPREHVAEATTLRRAAMQMESLNRVAADAAAQAKHAENNAANAKAAADDAKADARVADANVAAALDAKESEIKRLKDDLAKANAELDRIRKRLATPPSKP